MSAEDRDFSDIPFARSPLCKQPPLCVGSVLLAVVFVALLDGVIHQDEIMPTATHREPRHRYEELSYETNQHKQVITAPFRLVTTDRQLWKKAAVSSGESILA